MIGQVKIKEKANKQAKIIIYEVFNLNTKIRHEYNINNTHSDVKEIQLLLLNSNWCISKWIREANEVDRELEQAKRDTDIITD